MNITIDVDTLLRYALSGGVFVGSYLWLAGLPLTGPNAPPSSLLVAVSLLAGALIYSLHRGLIHPLFNRIIQRIMLGEHDTHYKTGVRVWSWNFAVLTKVELQALSIRKLLRRTAEDRAWYSRWASQTHFMYTAAEAYWLACVLVPLIGYPRPQWNLWLGIASVLLFAIAFQDDIRGASAELQTPPQA